jgi:hypothetical protein
MKRNIINRILFCLVIVLYSTAYLKAQNVNSILVDGESLDYTLRFNWKFIWINAGTASLQTHKTTYLGKPAYKTALIANTSKMADKIFLMRDTLETTVSTQLEPLFFQKRCLEGKDIVNEQVSFSMLNGQFRALITKTMDDGTIREVDELRETTIYDMVSLLQYVRSLDTGNLTKNSELTFYMAGGRRVDRLPLRYLGYENIESENGLKYHCQVFSLVKTSIGKKGKKTEEEVIRFFTTDDSRHIPIRIDLFLKFGVAKAILN